jgi:hypothetical protein
MAMPDLRRTIFSEVLEHLEESLIQGVHFRSKENTCEIKFANGSEIIGVSFGDRKYGKVKSLKLSGIILEEGTEFEDEFYQEGGGFSMFKARLRRIWNVPENFLIVATNPDDETHPLYRYFIEGEKNFPSRYVFYSITTENPYLDPVYIRQLQQDYSPLEAERYIRGKWVSLMGKGIYAAYDPNYNRIDRVYEVRMDLPLRVTWDFNIGHGKPLSAALFQYDPKTDTAHFFNESVIEGSYTQDICEDLWERGLLLHPHVIIHGDATGKARNPGSKLGNYDVIRTFLEQKQVPFEMKVPRSNPPIRLRHSRVNAYCRNDLGEHRLFIYKNAPVAHQGMLTTRLKKGAGYIEDDSKYAQHITTAMGYGLMSAVRSHNKRSNVRRK